MKSFKEFRREWVLYPSKEMIIEAEIKKAYDRYTANFIALKHYNEKNNENDSKCT